MLTKRLSTLLKYLKNFTTLIDVGTDHGYLPIHAIKNKTVEKAYAVDNKQGPLNQASENIKAANLDAYITLILASGIEMLPEDADVLVMSGMGGEVIYKALVNQPYKNLKRLILQPNTASYYVRKLTESKTWKIIDEVIVHEQDYFYPILVLERGERVLSSHEISFGPILLKQRSPEFKLMLISERDYLIKLINDIPYKNEQQPHLEKLHAIAEVLNEWNDC